MHSLTLGTVLEPSFLLCWKLLAHQGVPEASLCTLPFLCVISGGSVRSGLQDAPVPSLPVRPVLPSLLNSRLHISGICDPSKPPAVYHIQVREAAQRPPPQVVSGLSLGCSAGTEAVLLAFLSPLSLPPPPYDPLLCLSPALPPALRPARLSPPILLLFLSPGISAPHSVTAPSAGHCRSPQPPLGQGPCPGHFLLLCRWSCFVHQENY